MEFAVAAAVLTHTTENVEGSLQAGGEEEEEEDVGAPEGHRDPTSGEPVQSIATSQCFSL